MEVSYSCQCKSNYVFKLPFGEEIHSGTGGRNSAQGYGGGDSIRQKFTGYERDDETELDYFGARNYSYSLGRFVQVDPILTSGETTMPQSWNRFSYTMNNPLNRIDVLGFYTWGEGATDEYKEKFRTWLKDVEKARDSFKKDSKKWKKLNNILEKVGKEGDETITIRFSDTAINPDEKGDKKLKDNEVAVFESKGNVGRLGNKVLKPTYFMTFNTNSISEASAEVVAHEGQHFVDRKAWVDSVSYGNNNSPIYDSNLDFNWRQREDSAYEVSQTVVQGLNRDMEGLYKKSWGRTDEQSVKAKQRLDSARTKYMDDVKVNEGQKFSEFMFGVKQIR
jgi:RHS repeat-associated protein